jgi:hypothetical protein
VPRSDEENALQIDRIRLGSGLRSTATSLLVGVLAFLLMLPVGCGGPFTATASAEDAAAVPAREEAEAGDGEDELSAEELEELVGRIALYPDDLLAQVLPASSYPLDTVEAANFLEANAGATEPPEDSSWDPSVIALLHFPDVLAMMSDDVAWTRRLGDAVWTQEEDVYDAIQAFRLRTYAAGNLESGKEVVIVKEKETIQIVPADPEIIYVPVYQPHTVVVTRISYATPLFFWGTAVPFTAWAYSLTWGSHHHHHVHYHHHYHKHYRHHHYKKHHKHYNKHHKYGSKGGSWKPSHRSGGGRPRYAGGSKPGAPALAGSRKPGSSRGKSDRGKKADPRGGDKSDRVKKVDRREADKTSRRSDGKAERRGSRAQASQGSFGSYGRGNDTRKQSARGKQSREKHAGHTSRQKPRESARDSRGRSFGGYESGSSAKRSSSRGSASRGQGGGGRSRGGGGGRKR